MMKTNVFGNFAVEGGFLVEAEVNNFVNTVQKRKIQGKPGNVN